MFVFSLNHFRYLLRGNWEKEFSLLAFWLLLRRRAEDRLSSNDQTLRRAKNDDILSKKQFMPKYPESAKSSSLSSWKRGDSLQKFWCLSEWSWKSELRKSTIWRYTCSCQTMKAETRSLPEKNLSEFFQVLGK